MAKKSLQAALCRLSLASPLSAEGVNDCECETGLAAGKWGQRTGNLETGGMSDGCV